jgi:hypothetical protein
LIVFSCFFSKVVSLVHQHVRFISRRAISTASLKSVFEKVKTREPAQGGEFSSLQKQVFY